MAILAIFDLPTMTDEKYDTVIHELENAGIGNPEGRVHHVAAAKDGGQIIIDIGESEESLNKFSEPLIPILEGAGVTPAIPQIHTVKNTIIG